MISLTFSPLLFSLWLLFLWYKKNDSNRSESAYLGDGAVLELAGNSRELRELGGLLRREEIILNVSFASSVFAVVTRNAIDFCHSRKEGLIPTWVANLPEATERKKNISARAHKRTRTVRDTSRAFTVKNERKFVPWQ